MYSIIRAEGNWVEVGNSEEPSLPSFRVATGSAGHLVSFLNRLLRSASPQPAYIHIEQRDYEFEVICDIPARLLMTNYDDVEEYAFADPTSVLVDDRGEPYHVSLDAILEDPMLPLVFERIASDKELAREMIRDSVAELETEQLARREEGKPPIVIPEFVRQKA